MRRCRRSPGSTTSSRPCDASRTSTRICHAWGIPGIDDLDQGLIDLHLDDVHVVTQGGRNPSYREEDGARVMKQSEITIRIGLGRGVVTDTVWTCDFSHDYVTINADYRS